MGFNFSLAHFRLPPIVLRFIIIIIGIASIVSVVSGGVIGAIAALSSRASQPLNAPLSAKTALCLGRLQSQRQAHFASATGRPLDGLDDSHRLSIGEQSLCRLAAVGRRLADRPS